MNLEQTDEQHALRDTVRDFLTQHAGVAAHTRALVHEPSGTTPEVWRGLAALGATGVLVPIECGGAGMTMTDAAIVAEEMGASVYPGPWLSSAVAAPRAIARFSTEYAAAELLSALADGTTIATVGPLGQGLVRATESSAVSGDFIIADAAAADIILVPIDRGDDVAIFAVLTDLAQVLVTRETGIDETRRNFQVVLDEAPARFIGSAAPSALTALVDDVLVAEAASALGAAQRLIDLVVDYAKTRVQFGQPIGSFQSVAHLCVDMYERVELARSGVIHAAWAADTGDAGERHAATTRLKAFAGKLTAVGDTAIQVFGGIGYTWEHDAHFYLKRLLSWSSLLGNPDTYLQEIGSAFASSVVGALEPT
ncbi:MAG: acyl-CoA dehydrogenase family protein [Mycobacterium sp.]|uniref:acyl-CoA dehydrogenase family protein n=1 Tax=Mycobacterium sp. TaxID=1785 RepID=UPI003F990F1B